MPCGRPSGAVPTTRRPTPDQRPLAPRDHPRPDAGADTPATYRDGMPDAVTEPTENVLILSCPDQRGIVATVTALLFEHGANIDESQQFQDPRTDQFFMRIRFS